jgi:hypothetical protein
MPLNIIDSFEKTIVRAEMRNGRQLGGRRHVIAPLVCGAGSLVFRSLPPELPSADVRPRIGPGGRDIDRSTCRSPLPRAVDYAQQSVH